MSDFYCISAKHTHRRDLYITLWRPDDKGYCWALCNAGKYSRDRIASHPNYYSSGNGSVAVPCGVLDAIAIAPKPGHHENDAGPVIPNTRASWNLIKANLFAAPAYPLRPQFPGAPREKD